LGPNGKGGKGSVSIAEGEKRVAAYFCSQASSKREERESTLSCKKSRKKKKGKGSAGELAGSDNIPGLRRGEGGDGRAYSSLSEAAWKGEEKGNPLTYFPSGRKEEGEERNVFPPPIAAAKKEKEKKKTWDASTFRRHHGAGGLKKKGETSPAFAATGSKGKRRGLSRRPGAGGGTACLSAASLGGEENGEHGLAGFT